MKTTKYIVSIPIGGLCNRMRVIASTIELADRIGAKPYILWGRNSELNACFSDLFSDIQGCKVYDMESRWAFRATRMLISIIPPNKILNRWKEYIKWNIKQGDNKNEIEKGISNKAASYNLQGKFLASIEICEKLSGISNLQNKTGLVFLLVIDIPVDTNPIATFATYLTTLAEISSDWATVCSSETYKHLNLQIKDVPSKLISCWDFDRELSRW